MRRVPLLRFCAMAVWLWLLWGLLTWTATLEQLLYGAGYALALAVPLSALGEVGRPWRLLAPSRLVVLARLGGTYAWRMVAANLALTCRIWAPSRPLRSGMVMFPNPTSSDGALAALGIITSTVVDNQLVDVRGAPDAGAEPQALLQYHGVWITSGDPDENADRVTGSMPALLGRLTGAP